MLKPYPSDINTGGGTGCIEPVPPMWLREGWGGGNCAGVGLCIEGFGG